jgi:hypothetical protein
MVGAYVVFFFFLAWLARFHFRDILKKGIVFKPDQNQEQEWISTRLAFWGVILCSAGIIAWCHYFGISWVLSLLVVGMFFLTMLVAVRIVCQGGLAYFTLTAAPLDGMLAFFGPKAFTHVGILVAAVLQKVLFLDLRESLMPSLLHARKITSQTNNNRRIFIAILFLLAGGVILSFLAFLAVCYKYGVRELGLDWATRTTLAVYDNVFSMVESPVTPGKWPKLFIIVGALVMLVLVMCYNRFYWWPIHPIGYLMTYSSSMSLLWFSFFLGWLCSMLCMRYGGLGLFKNIRFFFIGLIIGDFLMAGSWALYGLFSDYSYVVLPL